MDIADAVKQHAKAMERIADALELLAKERAARSAKQDQQLDAVVRKFTDLFQLHLTSPLVEQYADEKPTKGKLRVLKKEDPEGTDPER